MLKGCDVSSFQGEPGDWTGLAGDIAWAAVKLSELSPAAPYVNPDAAADWAWLGENGKLRVAYLFCHPAAPVGDTVALFESTLNTLGYTDDDMIMLDFETTDGLGPADCAAWADSVAGLLRRDLDRQVILYTYLNFAWSGNCAGLGGLPLFISDPSAAPGHPTVPAPWGTWALHQYSISGNIDRDVANFASQQEMLAALGRPAPDPGPQPAPLPVTGDSDVFFSLPPGERIMFAPWTDAAGKTAAPYSSMALMLTGETGSQVTVTFWRGTESFPYIHNLTSGEAVNGAPPHGWPGVTAVTLARTDTNATAVASGILTRW